MTASNTAGGAARTATGATSFAPALSELLQAGLRYASAKASRKLEDWAADLNEFVASGGSATQAVVEGLKAELRGKNPVWAAVKGAWSGASPQGKLAIVLILLVAL